MSEQDVHPRRRQQDMSLQSDNKRCFLAVDGLLVPSISLGLIYGTRFDIRQLFDFLLSTFYSSTRKTVPSDTWYYCPKCDFPASMRTNVTNTDLVNMHLTALERVAGKNQHSTEYLITWQACGLQQLEPFLVLAKGMLQQPNSTARWWLMD